MSLQRSKKNISPRGLLARSIICFLIGVGLLCGSYVACHRNTQEGEIVKVLKCREAALSKKDIDLYMTCISHKYSDKGKTYESIKREVSQLFKMFCKIQLNVIKRHVVFDEDFATVIQSFVLSFKTSNGWVSRKGKELLVFKKEKSGWKIIKGL